MFFFFKQIIAWFRTQVYPGFSLKNVTNFFADRIPHIPTLLPWVGKTNKKKKKTVKKCSNEVINP